MSRVPAGSGRHRRFRETDRARQAGKFQVRVCVYQCRHERRRPVIVNGLTGKKLVEGIDDPKDARVRLLSLTPAGLTRCEEIGEYIRKTHEKLLLELDPEQRRTVLASLEVLRVGMEAVKKDLV